MALDPSIPLQIRPTIQQADPVEQYGRMLSLKHMQAQEERQRQLDPLILQQHQAAVKTANLQAAEMERQAQKEKDIARITGEAYGADKPADAEPPEAAPSSAKPGDPSVPAAATLQPATALQADAGELGPESPAAAPQPGATPPPAAAALKPLATMGGPAAATPATSNSPAPRETPDQKFTRLMNAAGHGQDVPRIMQNRAVARETQIKMQEMERDQRDNQIWEEVGPLGEGDPKKTLALAAKKGMSQKAQASIAKNMQDGVNARILERSRLSDAEKKEQDAKDARMDRAADRIAAFLKRDDQGMEENWQNFVTQLFNDKISTAEEHDAVLKLNGGKFPGRAAVRGILNEHASHKWLKDEAAVQLAATKETQAEADRKERLDQSRERLKMARETHARETATQRKNDDTALAYQALRESNDSGGNGVADARKNVANTAFYKDHPIGANRGGVLRALDEIEKNTLGADQKTLKLSEERAKAKMLEDAGIGPDGKAAGGGRGSPKVTPKPTPTAAPAKKETPKTTPAATPGTPQRMKNAAGHVIEYDPRLNAWVDAETRQPVQ